MLQRRFPSEGHCLTSCLSLILPRAGAPVFRPPFPHPNLFRCFNLLDSASCSTHSPFLIKIPSFSRRCFFQHRRACLSFMFFFPLLSIFLFLCLTILTFPFITLYFPLHYPSLFPAPHSGFKFRNRFPLEHLLGFRLPLFPPSSAFTDSTDQRHVLSKPVTAHTIPHQTAYLYVLGLILELLNP